MSETRNYLGIEINDGRSDLMLDFQKATLGGFYAKEDESFQELFARSSAYYGSNPAHRQRLYDAVSRYHFMYSSPISANSPLPGEGKVGSALGISCFVSDVEDTREGLVEHEKEIRWLTMLGGGCGANWEIRAESYKSNGVIPLQHVIDAAMIAYAQSTTRKGSYAGYLPISHPNTPEFLLIRTPSGDASRKCLGTGYNHGIKISKEFMDAVAAGKTWQFIDPHDKTVRGEVPARQLWNDILTTRLRTGEPYLFFDEAAQRDVWPHLKAIGRRVKSSNLCGEIFLPTEPDRTAVCCLSSLNADTLDEWEPGLIGDVVEMLDNVIEDFIARAPDELWRARKTASEERAIGVGLMGFHHALQQRGIPFESSKARKFNVDLFKRIRAEADQKSQDLAVERGEPLAMKGTGYRNMTRIAVAPNANSGVAANTSPSIEPVKANFYTHRTRAGSFPVKNKYLEKVLEGYGKNTKEVWNEILSNDGSVQDLDFLSSEEKEVYKTASEIDQRWVITHAADRGGMIDQGQSVNLFLKPGCSMQYVSDIHRLAYEKGLKSLYYLRTSSSRKAEDVSRQAERDMLDVYKRRSFTKFVSDKIRKMFPTKGSIQASSINAVSVPATDISPPTKSDMEDFAREIEENVKKAKPGESIYQAPKEEFEEEGCFACEG